MRYFAVLFLLSLVSFFFGPAWVTSILGALTLVVTVLCIAIWGLGFFMDASGCDDDIETTDQVLNELLKDLWSNTRHYLGMAIALIAVFCLESAAFLVRQAGHLLGKLHWRQGHETCRKWGTNSTISDGKTKESFLSQQNGAVGPFCCF